MHLDGLPGKAALQQRGEFIADFVPQRRRPSGQPEGHGELAVAKLDLVDLFELDGAAAGFGILESGKGVADGGFGEGRGMKGVPGVGSGRQAHRSTAMVGESRYRR